MATEELGFRELWRLLARHWKLIVGLAVAAGLATLLAVGFLLPGRYQATARLTIDPPEGDDQRQWPLTVYQGLLESERLVQKTTERLIAEGVLPAERMLVVGRDIESRPVNTAERGKGALGRMLALDAWAESRDEAAAVANAWARTFLEQSASMLRDPAAESATVLEQQLAPTRQSLTDLEQELSAVRDEFQEREEQLSTSWDRRISAAQDSLERAIAEYRSETRRLMEEAVAGQLGASGAGASVEAEEALLELVSVRAQLAQTPRVLTLEKAASDETLAELIVQGQEVAHLDRPLTTQEMNPLYDQLAVRALEMEREAKQRLRGSPVETARLLAQLEKLQLERSAGLAALTEGKSLEVRILRRRRSHALEDLLRERANVTAEYQRQLHQIRDLETKLTSELNAAVISRLRGEVDVVFLAAPAAAGGGGTRQLPLKTAAGTLLGAILGLMIALFRSAGTP